MKLRIIICFLYINLDHSIDPEGAAGPYNCVL